MDEQPNQPADQPTEEEIRAYEEQLKRIRVEDVVIQTVVSLLNLGGRKAGLGVGGPDSEDEKDLDQTRQAVEAVRALLPLVEGVLGPDAKQIRDVLSQLQMAYAREAGPSAAEAGAAPETPNETPQNPSDGPGPAQSSGRLWVPGQ